jgi:site-specific DNA recombinase
MDIILALIYCRVSSERQKNEGHGLDAQEHRCREYADQKGYRVETVFKDSFTGGGDFNKRPGMSDLLSYVNKNAHKNYVVIIDDIKRFARDTGYHLELRKLLRLSGVTLESPNFIFDESPEGTCIETVMAAFSQLEREQNKRQVVQKQKARLERGYWPFYPPPGYKAMKDPVHGKLLTPIEPKASVIKEAFEGFASGRFQEQVDMQRFLREKDFCDGKPVYLEKVKRLLERVIYAGYIEYPDWDVARRKGFHEPLISLETYERAQERLSGRTTTFARKDINEDFPVRGFILCSECLRPVTGSWTKGRKERRFPYYWCKTENCKLRYKSIRKNDLEDAFESVLKKLKPKEEIVRLTSAIVLDAWNKRMGRVDDLKRIQAKEILRIQAEIKTLLERVSKAKSEVVVEAYEKEIEKLSKREQVLQEQIVVLISPQKNFETALATVLCFLKSPITIWENGTLEDKRRVLKLVFAEKLVYSRETGFETAKLSIPLKVFELSAVSNSQDVEM